MLIHAPSLRVCLSQNHHQVRRLWHHWNWQTESTAKVINFLQLIPYYTTHRWHIFWWELASRVGYDQIGFTRSTVPDGNTLDALHPECLGVLASRKCALAVAAKGNWRQLANRINHINGGKLEVVNLSDSGDKLLNYIAYIGYKPV